MASTQSKGKDDHHDQRLLEIYHQARSLDASGLEALCPSYTELKANTERYTQFSLLGKGGLKEVYKCFDTKIQRWVALARLRPDRGADYYELFIHEVRLIASLNHPNIIKVYELGIDDDQRPFFVMDLKGSNTLADVAKQRSRSDLLHIFSKICDAIAYAHAQGVLHLDIKPENIQCDNFGEVLVCDWGLGKIWNPNDTHMEEMQLLTEVLSTESVETRKRGTPGYIAPEKLRAEPNIDAQADIYSLGCLLHYLLVDEPPLQGSEKDILQQINTSTQRSMRARYPQSNLPESLDAIVIKATAVCRQNRYGTVAALQADLQKYLNGFATRAERPSLWRLLSLFVKRHPLPIGVFLAAALTLSAISHFYKKHLAEKDRIAIAEFERAQRLDNKVDALGNELERSKQDIANEIAQTSGFVKQMAIFQRPVEAIKQTRILTNIALEIDPQSEWGILESIKLDCLQLNFKQAIQRASDAGTSITNQKSLDTTAREFPDFDYNQEKRPSLDTLTQFLMHIMEKSYNMPNYFERVISYDHACRTELDGYDEVLKTFLQLVNKQATIERFEYSQKTLTLDLKITGSKIMLCTGSRIQNASKESYLRFLPINHLKLECIGRLKLKDIEGLPIKSLDISKCTKAVFNGSIRLPHLTEIRITKGQHPEGFLQRRIHSNEELSVVILPAKL
ncbi:serine/threonine protein kinase [Rubritalea spongiae]|uniref:Serine/threonine protein kinase n=1 Tax=Rubritalea spongiae TaxID=430797 RepID=A0ABW5E6H4_9BACT